MWVWVYLSGRIRCLRLRCLRLRCIRSAQETCHVEYETFTMLCIGGTWEFVHVDVRAGGPAGALCLFYESQVALP